MNKPLGQIMESVNTTSKDTKDNRDTTGTNMDMDMGKEDQTRRS